MRNAAAAVVLLALFPAPRCAKMCSTSPTCHPKRSAIVAELAAFEKEVEAALRPPALADAVAQVAAIADLLAQIADDAVEPVQVVDGAMCLSLGQPQSGSAWSAGIHRI